MSAHRLIGRWRLGNSGTIIVKHVYKTTARGQSVARVSLCDLRQILVPVRDLETLRKGGHLTYVGR